MEISASQQPVMPQQKAAALNQGQKPLAFPEAIEKLALWDEEELKQPWLNDPGFEKMRSMREYLSVKESFAQLELFRLKFEFESFKRDLQKTNPEIARKNFNFTLDSAGGIRINDLQKNLSAGEKEGLVQALNDYRGFGDRMHNFAKTVSFLASFVNTETDYSDSLSEYGNPLNLDNFFENENKDIAWSQMFKHLYNQATPISERV